MKYNKEIYDLAVQMVLKAVENNIPIGSSHKDMASMDIRIRKNHLGEQMISINTWDADPGVDIPITDIEDKRIHFQGEEHFYDVLQDVVPLHVFLSEESKCV